MKFFDLKKNKPWTQDATIIMQLGLTMVGCIAFCFYIGFKLGELFGFKALFMIIFIVLGVVGGGVVCYRQILEITSGSKQGDNDNPPGKT